MAHKRKHASEHLIGGIDPIQIASNSQEGLASSTHISAIEANTTHRNITSGNPHQVTLEEARSQDNTLSGDISMGGNTITGLSTPINSTDAATKSYVDAAISTGVFWQEPVESITTTTPPGSPTDGERYIVPSGATGDWTGQTNYIAEWDATGTQWVFAAPSEGWTLWVKDQDKNYTYNGTSWIAMGSTIDHGNLSGLGDDDHPQYHNNTRGDARYYTKTLLDGGQLDNRYFTESEHINVSAGVGDAGKPIVLDANGFIDASMIDDSDIDHGSLSGLGDDDHVQYLLVNGTRAMTGDLNMGSNSITNGGNISAVEGHFSGEISIKVYSQSTQPTLAADNNLAIWIDTSDTNATYLIFRRGLGDQVLVELAV